MLKVATLAAMKRVEKRHSGHDWGPINLDPLGKAYIALAVLSSVILIIGISFLLVYRHLDFIRIRNISLMVSSLLMIHVYLVIVLLNYPLNGSYPCDLGYWVMNIYFPFGVALFQAQNIQLLSLSVLQKKLTHQASELRHHSERTRRFLPGLRIKWRDSSLLYRMYLCIGIGVVFQSFIVLIIFLASRKFHSFGVVSSGGAAASCRRGWEWIPSALWQGLWTYGFGPWLLYRIRNIDDTHKWRLQTSLAIAFCLPGLPLWLASLYAPGFNHLNHWWPPAMWYAPGLFMMEFVTIFFPLLGVYKSNCERKATSAAIVEWEGKGHDLESLPPVLLQSSSKEDTERQSKSDMCNMQALERALELHARELLEFAATKQFTGENIVFLTRVRAWKERWNRAALAKTPLPLETKNKLYEAGKEIFDRNISLHTSQFPINLESKTYRKLEDIFGSNFSSSPSSIITPFTELWAATGQRESRAGFEDITRAEDDTKPGPFVETLATQYGFDGQVFDSAERSIKYMVFTNTWARFLESSSRKSSA